jgi:DNA-binding IclR family transcriptional regulator
LFDALAKSAEGLTLAELNTALKSPKSSLLNLLRPLVADGFLTYADGHYILGPAIFRLASSIMSVWNFSQLVRPYLEELGRRTGESVYVGVLDRESKVITYVDALDSRHTVRYSVPIGAARPLYCTAAGRVLLAFSNPEFQDEYLRTTRLEPRTPRTISSRKALMDELHKILTTRISTSVGEMFPEAAGLAAPIFGADGRVIAAMAIGGPAERLQPRMAELKPILAEISIRASGIAPGVTAARAAPAARTERNKPTRRPRA